MTESDIHIVWLIITIMCTLIAPMGALAKKRNPLGWAAAGFFFGLFALVAIICLPPVDKEELA